MKKIWAISIIALLVVGGIGLAMAVEKPPLDLENIEVIEMGELVEKPPLDLANTTIIEMGELEAGKLSFGHGYVSTGETRHWTATGGPCVAVGLLWDERSNDLDLRVRAPDGTWCISDDTNTVTEECRLCDGTGTWDIYVIGYYVPVNPPQEYYIGVDHQA